MSKIKVLKRCLFFLLFLLAFDQFSELARYATGGFSMYRVQFSPSHYTTFEVPSTLSDEARHILQQPYHYLSKGNQCFVFASQDGQYVLKLFKYARHPVPAFLTRVPIINHIKPFKPHRYQRVLNKQKRDFESYQIAYEQFRNESALIAVHLSPTSPDQLPSIPLIDKLNIERKLDLNQVPFVLQKRAVSTYPQLLSWIEHGEEAKAQRATQSLIRLVKRRIELHLQDDDAHFYSNFGLIGEKGVQIDPGHFVLGDSKDPRKELKEISEHFIQWTQKYAPILTQVIQDEIDAE